MRQDKNYTETSSWRLRSARYRISPHLPWFVVLMQTAVIIFFLTDYRQIPPCRVATRCQTTCPDGFVGFSNTSTQGTPSPNIKVLQDVVDLPQNPTRIFYNRVPKTGSTGMIDLIIEMTKANNFTFKRAAEYMRFYLDDHWQRNFVYNRFLALGEPMLYERHLHFLDFERFTEPMPVYFNIIRDPLDRLVSWYYFRRYQDGHVRDMPLEKRWKTYDECVLNDEPECTQPLGDLAEEGYFKIIPFFCGQEPMCRVDGEEAMMRAIFNVKKYYLVVGVTEDLPNVAKVLEVLLPKFFKGASNVFSSQSSKWREKHGTTYKLPVSSEVKTIMRQKLKWEYKFYNFVQNRFRTLNNTIDQYLKLERMGVNS